MKSDIEIAMEADLLPIQQVAEKLNITKNVQSSKIIDIILNIISFIVSSLFYCV